MSHQVGEEALREFRGDDRSSNCQQVRGFSSVIDNKSKPIKKSKFSHQKKIGPSMPLLGSFGIEDILINLPRENASTLEM